MVDPRTWVVLGSPIPHGKELKPHGKAMFPLHGMEFCIVLAAGIAS